MNTPELSNYMQYLNQNNQVKSKQIYLSISGDKTLINFDNIDEPFFILSLFINNTRQYGIGFENKTNIDMLSFLNSDITDIDLVQQISFFNENETVILSIYTTAILPIISNNSSNNLISNTSIKFTYPTLVSKPNTMIEVLNINNYNHQNYPDSYFYVPTGFTETFIIQFTQNNTFLNLLNHSAYETFNNLNYPIPSDLGRKIGNLYVSFNIPEFYEQINGQIWKVWYNPTLNTVIVCRFTNQNFGNGGNSSDAIFFQHFHVLPCSNGFRIILWGDAFMSFTSNV